MKLSTYALLIVASIEVLPLAGCGSGDKPQQQAVLTQPAQISPYTDMGDGTVYDRSTNLRWLKNADCF